MIDSVGCGGWIWTPGPHSINVSYWFSKRPHAPKQRQARIFHSVFIQASKIVTWVRKICNALNIAIISDGWRCIQVRICLKTWKSEPPAPSFWVCERSVFSNDLAGVLVDSSRRLSDTRHLVWEVASFWRQRTESNPLYALKIGKLLILRRPKKPKTPQEPVWRYIGGTQKFSFSVYLVSKLVTRWA